MQDDVSRIPAAARPPTRAAVLRIAALWLAALTLAAHAAEPSRWADEPAGLSGIALGKPFPAAGEIADCPLFEPFRRENLPDELCVDTRKGFSTDAITLAHVPLGTVSGNGRVELRDGLVRAIRVTFDRRNYAAAKAVLLDRYGPSHARAVEESGETLTWSGAHVAMSLSEDAGDGTRAAFEIRARSTSASR